MENTNPKSELEVRQLKHQGNNFYPLTNVKSVINSNGDSVDIILSESDKKLLEGYAYEGQAMPDTVPANLVPKAKVYYLAVTKGVYKNFKNGNTPIEITEEGTFAIKHDTVKWYLEKMELSTTTDKIYDETTDTYVEDSLITPQLETYAMVDDEIEVLLRTALRKTSQLDITEAEKKQVYQNLGLDTKFESLENRITDGYKYIGIATPGSTPSVKKGHVYYVAIEKGSYENYGNVSFDHNGIYLLKYDGNWHMEALLEIAQELGNSESAVVSQKTVKTELGKFEPTNFNSIIEVPTESIIEGNTDSAGLLIYDKTTNKFLWKVSDKYYTLSSKSEIVGTEPIKGHFYIDSQNNTWVGTKHSLCLIEPPVNELGDREDIAVSQKSISALDSKILYIPLAYKRGGDTEQFIHNWVYDIILQKGKRYFIKHLSGDRGNLFVDGGNQIQLVTNEWVEFYCDKTDKPITYVDKRNIHPEVVFADSDGVINEIFKLYDTINGKTNKIDSKIFYSPNAERVTNISTNWKYDIELQYGERYYVKHISGDINNFFTSIEDAIPLKTNEWVEFNCKKTNFPQTHLGTNVNVKPIIEIADAKGVIKYIKQIDSINKEINSVNNRINSLDNIAKEVAINPNASISASVNWKYDVELKRGETYYVKHLSGDKGNFFVSGSDEIRLITDKWVEFNCGETGKPQTHTSGVSEKPVILIANNNGLLQEIKDANKKIDSAIWTEVRAIPKSDSPKLWEYPIELEAGKTYYVKYIDGDLGNFFTASDSIITALSIRWQVYKCKTSGKPKTYVSIRNNAPVVKIADSSSVAEELIDDIVYVATDGDDKNDGTFETPFATFQNAIKKGYRNIVGKPGIYKNQKIMVNGVNNLRISCQIDKSKQFTYIDSTPRIGHIILDNSKDIVTTLDGATGLRIADKALVSKTRWSAVFVEKTLKPIRESVLSPSYNVILWELGNNEVNDLSKHILLKPVLTLQECKGEKGTFYYDGARVYINPKNDDFVKFVENIEEYDVPIVKIENSNNIEINGIDCMFSSFVGMFIKESNNIEIADCHVGFTSWNGGFRQENSNTTFRDCIAYKINLDGFAPSGVGNNNFYNCCAYYCGDDGISHHNYTTGVIDGGIWQNCRKGGISPSHGSKVFVRNVLSTNNRFGLYYWNDIGLTSPKSDAWMQVQNCVFADNIESDVITKNYNLYLSNCTYKTIRNQGGSQVKEYGNNVIS